MHSIDPRLNEAVIPPSVLSGILDLGQRDGREVGSWFSATGVDPSSVTSEAAKVSFRQAASVLRRAVRAMPDRPLGMQLAGRDALLTFGMLGVAMRACATAGEALEVALDLHQAAGSLVDIHSQRVDGHAVVEVYERSPEPELVAFLCEESLCSTVAFLRSFVDPGLSPTALEFTYSAPSYVSEYHRFFRCPIEFESDANRMSFPESMLELPMPTLDRATKALAVETCRRLLDTGDTRSDVVSAVEATLSTNLRHPLAMAEVAENLGVSERTLHRQLATAGERFGQIRDRVRERRATFLLTETLLSVAAVGREVGFSNAREFRRAYVRWTGQAPRRLRQH